MLGEAIICILYSGFYFHRGEVQRSAVCQDYGVSGHDLLPPNK